jgi:hypothetical protein
MKRWKTALGLACLLALSALQVFAQEPPTVDDVVNRFLEAEGGRDRIEAIQTRVATGTVSIPAFGLDGTFEIVVAPPNMVTRVDFTAMNIVSRSGVADGVAWQIDPTTGASILTGADAFALRLQAAIDPILSWHDYFESAEVVGEATVAGHDTYQVVFHAEDGADLELDFDKSTGLIMRQLLTQGAYSTSTDLDDYRAEDGILLPHTIHPVAPEGELILTVETFEQNVDVPAEWTALPEEIRRLQGSN